MLSKSAPRRRLAPNESLRRAVVKSLLAALLLALLLPGCKRKAVPHDRTSQAEHAQSKTKAKPKTHRVMAAWYAVPENSLARRRGGDDEMTAAHNHLPIGTRVRVTNPDNDQSVVVRITDRGIHDSRVQLDLSKEAASALGIVREGIAPVKMEVLGDEGESGSAEP
ncbi:MAG: septal ring lytic transglycosylase RlpA family protein [Verrucomicrobiota bacterium]|nr:septal ring lytic transglycosylase RlpA family protein [Verrucomicrobiota bacterium]